MNRSGTVVAINQSRGMVAISTEDDGFTIIELLSDSPIEIGDSLAWANGYGLGSEVYENLKKRTREEVYVQNHAGETSGPRQAPEQPHRPKAEARGGKGKENVPRLHRQMRVFKDDAPDVRCGDQAKNYAGDRQIRPHEIAPGVSQCG
jgi:hypothetical protein